MAILSVVSNPRFRLIEYCRLIRLHRPIGSFLLLWPTLTALWIAGQGHPHWKLIIIFTLGTFLMRSAGCAMNDTLDRHYDKKIKRTCQRPLARNAITPQEALGVFVFLALLAFFLVLLTNTRTILLACVGIVFVIFYPLTKRFFYFPQLVLGCAFAWAIPMAFSAQMNTIPRYAWILYLATLFWAVAYDTLYAIADSEDDQKIGLKSTALFFGKYRHLMVGLTHGITLLLLVRLGLTLDFHVIYFIGLFLAMLNAIYQQVIIQPKTPDRYLRAFFNNHWMMLIVFLSVIANYQFVSFT